MLFHRITVGHPRNVIRHAPRLVIAIAVFLRQKTRVAQESGKKVGHDRVRFPGHAEDLKMLIEVFPQKPLHFVLSFTHGAGKSDKFSGLPNFFKGLRFGPGNIASGRFNQVANQCVDHSPDCFMDQPPVIQLPICSLNLLQMLAK